MTIPDFLSQPEWRAMPMNRRGLEDRSMSGRDSYHTRPVLALALSMRHGISVFRATEFAGVRQSVVRQPRKKKKAKAS